MSKILVDYIREHGLDGLESKLSIHVKRHPDYNNLVLLKYDQLNSPLGNKVVQKCRGIILDEDQDWKVISYPYDKFFNYGEGHADEIDWETARVYEKLDGSIMTLYYYNDAWNVASSGLPGATGEIMGTTTTFGQLFWKVFDELGYSTPELPEDENVCYMFELMTPFNRVVVRHKENKLVLHGARQLTPPYKELNPIVVAHQHGWECVETHPLTNWDEVVAFAKTRDPMDAEGFVVCDSNYNRVKVKSPQYVAVAHMKDGFTTRRLLEIVRTNENSEFLSYYPEYKDLYYEIRIKYERLVGKIEGFYEAIKHIDDRKKFASHATTQKFSGTLFNLKFNKIDNVKESLAEMNLRQLEQWLGMKSVEL